MQAAVKAAIAEATRSLSIALIVRAGGPSCPEARLTCPEHQRCPDCHCVCQDGARISPRALEVEAGGWTPLVLAVLLGVLVGSVGQQVLTYYGTVRGQAVRPRVPTETREAVAAKPPEAADATAGSGTTVGIAALRRRGRGAIVVA